MLQEPLALVPTEDGTFMAHNSGKFGNEESFKALPKAKAILITLTKVADGLQEYKLVLIPVILSIISDATVLPERRLQALKSMMYLVSNMELHQLVGRIVHPLVRLLSCSDTSLVEASLTSLSILACRLGRSYEPFIVPVRRKTRALAREGQARLKQLVEYDYIVSLIIKDRPLPRFPETATTFLHGVVEAKKVERTMKSTNDNLRVNMSMVGRLPLLILCIEPHFSTHYCYCSV